MVAPVELERPSEDVVTDPDVPWIVLVWNDPINLMDYVTYVIQKLFGYPKEKADRLRFGRFFGIDGGDVTLMKGGVKHHGQENSEPQ